MPIKKWKNRKNWPKQKEKPYLKNRKQKDGVAQMVESLPSKGKALSTNHSTAASPSLSKW
jgi:uncharacterized protein YjcR